MNKKQVLSEIMDLYEENDNLKRQLKGRNETKTQQICQDGQLTTKELAIKKLENEARKCLFGKIIYDWNLRCVKVEVEEDSGEFNFLTFEQWLKSVDLQDTISSSYRHIFDDLTSNDIKEYFRNQFEEYYKKLVDEKKMKIVRSKKDE